MKGNQYSKGGDPMLTRSEKRRQKKAKLATTGRVMRLHSRLKGIRNRKDKREGNHHTTALMESYVTRRKQQRAEEKKKQAELDRAAEATKKPDSGASSSPVASKKAVNRLASNNNNNGHHHAAQRPHSAPQHSKKQVSHGGVKRRAPSRSLY